MTFQCEFAGDLEFAQSLAGAVPVLQHPAGRGVQYDKVELRRDSQPELLDDA